MLKIWKYPLLDPDNRIVMPAGSIVLTVGLDGVPGRGGLLCLWVEVDTTGTTERATVERRFVFYGTGHTLPDHRGTYLGTVNVSGTIIHVYERTGLSQ